MRYGEGNPALRTMGILVRLHGSGFGRFVVGGGGVFLFRGTGLVWGCYSPRYCFRNIICGP